MRICLFGDARSIHLQRLAVGLAKRGITVHVVSHKPAEIPGARVEEFRIPPVAWSNPRRWRLRWRNYLRGFLRKFDVVNVHFLSDWGFEPDMLDKGRVVVSAWGSDVIAPPGEDPPSPQLTDTRVALLRHAAAVTAWGPAFARTVADFARMPVQRVDVLPLGVDLALFHPGRVFPPSTGEGTGSTAELMMPACYRACHPAAVLTNSAGRRSFARRSPITSARIRSARDAAACVRHSSVRLANVFSGTAVYGPSFLGTGSATAGPSATPPGSIGQCPHVGFFKGFRAVYGAEYLIRAIPLVLEQLPAVRVDFIGDGPQRAACQRLASQLAIDDFVRWIPPQPHNVIPRWLASWDVTVVPSLCEAFGFAALESQAMRVPVVASDVGGLPDAILDGKTGLLVPPRSPKALADAIITLLTDPVRRRNMGRAGREWVTAHFEQEHVLDQWIALYERVLDTAAGCKVESQRSKVECRF